MEVDASEPTQTLGCCRGRVRQQSLIGMTGVVEQEQALDLALELLNF